MRYLTIGHICKDVTPDGWVFGGTATYASRTARALGCEVTIVTSAEAGLDLRPAVLDIDLIQSPSNYTTTFENIYTDHSRRQILHAIANRLDPNLIKVLELAQGAAPIDIVHFAPIAQEIDRTWLDRVRDTFIGVTPQGWLREWDEAGHVSYCEWTHAEEVLRKATATVFSIEDVHDDEALIKRWATWARLLVVTRGALGCTVYYDGVVTDLPARNEIEVDPTGAGDIFAAAFFMRLKQTGSPLTAARFANCIAGKSITRRGIDSVPTPDEVQLCLSTGGLGTLKIG